MMSRVSHSKPIVGVMPLWDDERESLWMLPGYFDGLVDAGAVPFMLPLTKDEDMIDRLLGLCDGVLFTGGQDVQPALYGEECIDGSVVPCKMRDDMEKIVLDRVMARDMPLLGICRGIQFVNAALGGTLYQDLPTQHKSQVEHHQHAPYDVPVHEVEILRDAPLYDCLGVDRLAVNSYHHQSIKRLADGLQAMAVATDGIVEAVRSPRHKFLWAVQWHPEFSFRSDEASRKIFAAFVSAMR